MTSSKSKPTITTASVQVELAKAELQVHHESVEQTTKVEQFLHSKFTNKDLYQWMTGRLSGLYFQAYKIALELAYDAQRAYQYELNAPHTYIQSNDWDNLKKGLLAGESLMLGLNQLEKAYLNHNERRFEIEKTISLLQLDPQALLDLKTTGKCTFDLDAKLFALDFPSHYCRKIKTLSISIPAVVGPYQNINATLTQNTSQTLLKPDEDAVESLLTGPKKNTALDGTILQKNIWPNQQIAISKGVDDTGMFVLNFADERYLPFEGTGAISSWTLELPKTSNAIDFDSITDVILSLKYTALQGGSTQQGYVKKYLTTFNGTVYLSLAQQFSSAWYQFMNPSSNATEQKLTFTLPANLIRPNLKNPKISAEAGSIYLQIIPAEGIAASSLSSDLLPAMTLSINNGTPIALKNAEWRLSINPLFFSRCSQDIGFDVVAYDSSRQNSCRQGNSKLTGFA